MDSSHDYGCVSRKPFPLTTRPLPRPLSAPNKPELCICREEDGENSLFVQRHKSHLYAKVVVVSKAPLTNYRFDLDERRPQRERVDSSLEDYVSQKSANMDSFQGNDFPRSNSSCSFATASE